MSDEHPVRRLVGGLLMAVGALIAALCGLCTGVLQVAFLYDALTTSGHGGEINVPTLTPLVVGGLPTLIGIGLFLWGRWLVRTSDGVDRTGPL